MKPITIPENPYIKADNSSVAINYQGQSHKLQIHNIANVYLKKSKMTYIPSFMNTMFSYYEKRYKLYIRTNDSSEIRIKVKAGERQYFLGLISHIRNEKARIATSLAS